MRFLTLAFLLGFSLNILSQVDSVKTKTRAYSPISKPTRNHGKFFIHWGYNRGWYTNSDIHFKGDGYDFTLKDAEAKDRPTPFQWGQYFHPANLTIPQTNLKFGYFINEKWALSFGVDHMKYVMQTAKNGTVDGTIDVGSIYDGVYNNDEVFLSGSFVLFEHTDGLNYINLEADRYTYIKGVDVFKVRLTLENNSGLGAGILLPKTNATLFKDKNRDDFNIAGLGLNAKTGLKLSIGKYFYIQSELKGGYINMPWIRVSPDKSDKANQYFMFAQFNWLIGLNFNTKKEDPKNLIIGNPNF